MNLADIIARIKTKHILIIGDAMLDHYIEGQVNRISPEAPVLVMRKAQSSLHAGGAANVARNITSLGARAHLLSVTGEDLRGKDLQDLLAKNIENHGTLTYEFLRDVSRPTTLKTRHIAQGQHLLRSDDESTKPLTPILEAELLAKTAQTLPQADYVILSDYAKGVLNETSLPKLIALIKQQNVGLVVDPKKQDFSLFRGADLITPNRNELAAAAMMPVTSDLEITQAARYVIAKFGVQALLITRSEQGMSYVSAEQAVHIDAHVRSVFDVAGAGDTVIAALTVALAAAPVVSPVVSLAVNNASKLDKIIEQAMNFANLAAAVSVSKKGTAMVAPYEITRLVARNRLRIGTEKIMSLETLQQQCELWHGQGLKIGFTNGCFDILHHGHVHSLSQAALCCDRLILGINSDASITRLKGKGRPINQEASRAVVLAGLTACDAVIVFVQDTPLELIETLKPDFLFKGEDYAFADIVGADFVESYGGIVKRISLVPDISTTKLIARMQN